MPTGYRFIVRGRVQGVGFHQAAALQAQQLELDGWILNRAVGAVEGEVHHESLDVLTEFQR
jgi:acylphosphatase